MVVYSQLAWEEIEVTVCEKGEDGWHSWSVPNVGFSRRFSSRWQLSSGGQWSDPQTLEIPRMPVVETQRLVWPVDYCLSGSMTTSALTLSLGLNAIIRGSYDFLSVQVQVIFWLKHGVYWSIFWKILVLRLFWLLIVPNVERRVKFSLLNSPSFPPAALAVWTVEGHCFSVTEGREKREAACYLTLKATTLWLTMWPIMWGGTRRGQWQEKWL